MWYCVNIVVVPWCSGYHYYTFSFNKVWTLHSEGWSFWSMMVLGRFNSCSHSVRDWRWWVFLTMVPARNKAKCLSLVNHTTKQFIIIIIIIIKGFDAASNSWCQTFIENWRFFPTVFMNCVSFFNFLPFDISSY